MAYSRFRDFFDLGFYPLELGSARRFVWEVCTWLLLACGIFLRQGLEVTSLTWHIDKLSLPRFFAAVAISFALVPSLTRWINRKRPDPGLEQVALPFTLGFFLDIAAVAAVRLLPQV
jgi:hypothetical protein